MKKLILPLVLSLSVSAYAARDIYDIMYLPNAGTTYGITEGTKFDRSIEVRRESNIDLDGYILNQIVGHAFTDRFSLAASMNYTDFDADADPSTTNLSGLSDPSVTARFRTVDETFRWDLIGGALISTGDAEIESNGDRDNLQGGNSYFLGTQFGTKTDNVQWALLAQFTLNEEATIDTQVTDVNVDANNEFLLKADILNRLAEKSFLRTFASANFAENTVRVKLFDMNEEASAAFYSVGTEYQYLASKDFLLRAGLDYYNVQTMSGQVDSWDGWNYRIGLNYQF